MNLKSKFKLLNPHRAEWYLVFRALGYVLTIGFYTASFSSLVPVSLEPHSSTVLLAAFGILMVQSVVSFLPKVEQSIFPFLLADLVFSTLLTRMTGGSSSLFLIYFSVLTLAVSVSFETIPSFIYLTAAVFFLNLIMGWSVMWVGNTLAILAIGFLGNYLVRALNLSSFQLTRSESARKKLEALQKAILQSIPSGLLTVDTFGNVIQINQVGLQILGFSEEQIVGKKLLKFLPKLNLEKTFERMERLSTEYTRPDGQTLYLGYSYTELSTTEKLESLSGTLFVFQDLTHIIQMEHKVRISEKLAAIGKLAAGIAHEIRNPLAGISGSAQLLENMPNLNDEDQKLLGIIQRESKRLDLLISEFLEYVKPTDFKLDKFNLWNLVYEVQENLKVSQKWMDMKCTLLLDETSPRDLEIYGEPNKLNQVLMNLIINSGQAGASQVLLRFDSKAQFQIIDDGAGIGIENQKRLFEPFFTTKERGTGLGLAVSYKILEGMGAQIQVESPVRFLKFESKTAGTCFTIQFQSTGSSSALVEKKNVA